MKSVWLSIGGNVGDVQNAMAATLNTIQARADCRVESVSSLYRTTPWGLEDQSDFLNMAWEIKTALPPEDFLTLCLDLERRHLRERGVKWGPRTLDIDVLIYEGIDHYHSATLDLPHPFMTERAFVLIPLCEIAPLLPVKGKTVAEWAHDIEKKGIERLSTSQNWWQV